MYFTEGKESQLNDLLNRIGAKLQLDKTRKERVDTSYNALCDWIRNDEGYFSNFDNLDFYAQGSYRTLTTVKPLSEEEFDLDFVLEINGDWKNEDPLTLLKQLERRFKEHELYKTLVEVKNRCIRINYANEFHIDILPGFPENKYLPDNKIKVPDRNDNDWTDSNPKDYSKWFDDMCNKFNKQLLEKRVTASVEPLPEAPPYGYIEPLRRSVQLMKRFRDVYYKDKDSSGVRSIVITTLAGTYYSGEDNEYIAISNILQCIQNEINKQNGNPLEILNPANTAERLSEKWDSEPKAYKDFCNFIYNFKNKWSNLMKLESLKSKAIVLQELFGETVSQQVLKEQAEYINKSRSSGKLGVSTSTGILTFLNEDSSNNLKAVTKNTFFGE